MKRFRWPIIIVVLFAAWLATERWLYRRTVPPAGVTNLYSFLSWQENAKDFTVLKDSSGEHLMATGPGSGLLPSGPAAYVFDSTGQLVDWSHDIGDDPDFDQRWLAQRTRGMGTTIPRSAVSEWLAPTTQHAADPARPQIGP